MKAAIMGVIGVVCLGVLLLPVIFLLAVGAVVGGTASSRSEESAGSFCSGTAAVAVDTAQLPTVSGFSKKQVWAAAYILKAGEDAGVGARGQLIALMVALQESTLGTGRKWDQPNNDGDAGYFQQRVLPGWYGTLDEVNDPYKGAMIFFEGVTVKEKFPGGNPVGYHIPGLKNVEGWQQMSPDAAAHQVQRSQFPKAILKHEGKAQTLMTALSGAELPASSAACTPGLPVQVVDGLPTEEQIAYGSVQTACPDGTIDLGVKDGGYRGQHVPVRICVIPDTECTGGGCYDRQVMANSVVAPYFMEWLRRVREMGHKPVFSSTFRTWAQQPTGPNAASKGWSHHQLGAAFDLIGLQGKGGSTGYFKSLCPGQTSDGSCYSLSPEWKDYHSVGLSLGAAFHPEEWWHLEWVISSRDSRNLPF